MDLIIASIWIKPYSELSNSLSRALLQKASRSRCASHDMIPRLAVDNAATQSQHRMETTPFIRRHRGGCHELTRLCAHGRVSVRTDPRILRFPFTFPL
jgi:hypothetical protein